MKIYYDMLVPYMPNRKIVNDKAIDDPKLAAARQTMVMLASFQNEHTLNALYDAVYQISIYGDINIVDLIYSLEEVEELPLIMKSVDGHGGQEVYLINDKKAAETKQKENKRYVYQKFYQNNSDILSEDPYSFDYKQFAAILLSVGHALLTHNSNPESNGDTTN